MLKLTYLPIILFSVLLGSETYDSISFDQVPEFGVLLYQIDDTTVKIVKLGEFSGGFFQRFDLQRLYEKSLCKDLFS